MRVRQGSALGRRGFRFVGAMLGLRVRQGSALDRLGLRVHQASALGRLGVVGVRARQASALGRLGARQQKTLGRLRGLARKGVR